MSESPFLDKLSQEERLIYDEVFDFIRYQSFLGWIKKLKPQFDTNEAANGRTIYSRLRHTMRDRANSPLTEWVTEKEYYERLNFEFDLFYRLGFIGYFAIIWDICSFCKMEKIPRGDSRGSVGASLVAYLLDITKIDPVKHNLLLYRFISEDRTDLPDIDLDFAAGRREEIKDYLKRKYGREHVAEIGTLMRFQGKAVLQAVARAFEVPMQETMEAGRNLIRRARGDARAHKKIFDSQGLDGMKEYAEKYPHVIHHADLLEMQIFGSGVHASGVVISDQPLREFTPMVRHGNEMVLGAEMIDCEALGLLKVDILGIRPPELAEACFNLIRKRHDVSQCSCQGCERSREAGLDRFMKAGDFLEFYDAIPIEDEKVFEMFGEGMTYGVMQLETLGPLRFMQRLKPTEFQEVADANALYRPGAMQSGGLKNYINRRSRKEEVPKLHPIYDAITAITYGTLLYQEQVMEILYALGGFSWTETEKIRKQISKSIGRETLMAYKEKFIEGAIKKECDSDIAGKIFDNIADAGSYLFNMPHSVGYSYISVKMGWIKSTYPAEFICSCLNSTSRRDKISGFIREAKRMGIPVKMPDINTSDKTFQIRGASSYLHLRAGFDSIRGVGEASSEAIVAVQREHGPFKDWDSFLKGISLRRRHINKGIIKSLMGATAMESILPNTKASLEGLELLLDDRKKSSGEKEGLLAEMSQKPAWTEDERTLSQAANLMIPPERSVIACYDSFLKNDLSPRLKFRTISSFGMEEEVSSTLICAVITLITEVFREKMGRSEDSEHEDDDEETYLGSASIILEDDIDFVGGNIDSDTFDRLRPILKKAEGEVAILRVQKMPYSERVNILDLTLIRSFVERFNDSDLTSFERYLISDPLQELGHLKNHFGIQSIKDILKNINNHESAKVWGTVVGRRIMKRKEDQKEFASLTLEESGSQIEVMVWAESFEHYRETVMNSDILVIKGNGVSPNEYSKKWKLGVGKNGKIISLQKLQDIYNRSESR